MGRTGSARVPHEIRTIGPASVKGRQELRPEVQSCGYRARVPVTALLPAVDALVAVGLLWSVPRSRRNRPAVIAVAAVLLGVSGWLAVLALTPGDSQAPNPHPSGQVV